MAREVMMSDVMKLIGLDAFNKLLALAISSVQYAAERGGLAKQLAEECGLAEVDVAYQIDRVKKDLCAKIAKIKLGRKV